MRGAVKLERDSLIDGHGHSLGGVTVVAGVNWERLSLHPSIRLVVWRATIARSGSLFDSDGRREGYSLPPFSSRTSQSRILPKSPGRFYFVVAITLEAGTDAGLRESDFLNRRVRVRAVKSAPNANRMSGPKLLAAAMPT